MRLTPCTPPPLPYVLLLLCFLHFCLKTTNAQEYVTSITCSNDEDCNKGVCQDNNHVCRCEYLYYPNESNTIPCNTPVGFIYPALVKSILIFWLITVITFFSIHTGVIVAFTRERRKNPPKNKSWQVDPRFIISLLWVTTVVRFFHFFFMYYYCFGEVKNTHFRILVDVGRALFFEVGAAIIFYWFIAVSAATNRQRMYGFLRVPVLAITGVILLVWICVGNFGFYSTNKSVKDGTQSFDLYFVLLILLSLMVGLMYYGLRITKLLVTKDESTNILVSRISKALVFVGAIIFCAALFEIVELSVPLFTKPVPSMIFFFWQIIIDSTVHGTTLMIFGGGTVKKIIKIFLYIFTFRRFGFEFRNELSQLEGWSTTSSGGRGGGGGGGGGGEEEGASSSSLSAAESQVFQSERREGERRGEDGSVIPTISSPNF